MFFSSGQKQVWMKNRVRKRKKSGKKRKGRKQISNKRQLAITILFLAVFISILHSSFLWKPNSVSGISPKQEEGSDVGSRVLPAEDGPCGRPEITEDFLDKNPYSRSGIALRKVKGVVIHYVENPGSTAKENRDYFNNLQNTHLTKASSLCLWRSVDAEAERKAAEEEASNRKGFYQMITNIHKTAARRNRRQPFLRKWTSCFYSAFLI